MLVPFLKLLRILVVGLWAFAYAALLWYVLLEQPSLASDHELGVLFLMVWTVMTFPIGSVAYAAFGVLYLVTPDSALISTLSGLPPGSPSLIPGTFRGGPSHLLVLFLWWAGAVLAYIQWFRVVPWLLGRAGGLVQARFTGLRDWILKTIPSARPDPGSGPRQTTGVATVFWIAVPRVPGGLPAFLRGLWIFLCVLALVVSCAVSGQGDGLAAAFALIIPLSLLAFPSAQFVERGLAEACGLLFSALPGWEAAFSRSMPAPSDDGMGLFAVWGLAFVIGYIQWFWLAPALYSWLAGLPARIAKTRAAIRALEARW